MPPKRAATAGSKSARRAHHGWHNDSASKHSRSSLDVLLAWLTTPGNYSRWAARSSGFNSSATKANGEGRLSLCKEVNALLQREGIAHRKDMDVYAKIVVIEKSFHAAKKWLEETALMPKFLHGMAGKDVEANVNQLCRHYKELAPAFAATSNETAASEVVDIEDDEENDGAKSDTTTSTDDAEEKPRAINGHNEQVTANEAAGGEQGPPSRADIANESIDEMSSSQPELYTLSPVHDKPPGTVAIATTTTSSTSPQQQKQVSENGSHRSVQYDEFEETKENGPPEPDSPSQESQRSSSSPASSNKFKRIRQRIASQLSDDEAEPPVSSASSEQQEQQQAKQQGTPIAPRSATTLTKVLATVKRGDVGSPAREKTVAARQIEKPSIAPKRKTSGLLKDAIAATSAELSPPSSRKKQKTQWTEQQELKKKQQQEQEEEKMVKQEYLKKQQQQELEKTKEEQQQEELKRKKVLHQEELKKKHQLRQEELSKKRQQEYERKKQQELKELKKKQQRREDLLNKKRQQEEDEASRKKQEQEEAASKKTNAVSTPSVLRSLEKSESQQQQQQQRHPEELQAILRACEDEREQRHALFQLQCDKLMQELEEKKIKVVYETALARKKLLDIGVAQSEVDRILPL
ncbi:hypothetical protein Gpo141_00003241 [Globisporangium polare]